MSIRKIIVKKLPKGERYVVPLRKLKSQFAEELEVGLFMTNDRFSFDRACKKCPEIEGTVVLTASYSFNSNSRYLHLFKIKDGLFSSKLEEAFIEKKLDEVKNWFKTTEASLHTHPHNSLIYSVLGDKINVYRISWTS